MKQNIILVLAALVSLNSFAQVISLDSCKKLALENNRTIKEAKLMLKESEQVKKSAATKYFPVVMGGAVVMKVNDYLINEEIPEMNLPVYDGNPANLQTPTQFAYFPGMDLQLLDYANIGYLAAVQPVYMGGRVRYGNKLATMGVEINSLKMITTQDEILMKTEELFWTLVSLKEKVSTIDEYDKLLQKLHKEIKDAYYAGLAHKTDLLKVELKQNELEGNRLKLANSIEMLTRVLCQTIGVSYSKQIDFSYEELSIELITKQQKHNDSAYSNRNEYFMLKKAIEAEILQKKITRGKLLPHLSVGVQGLYMDVMDKQKTNYLGFATLNIPISHWWEGSHKLKEHQIRIEIAETNLAENSDRMMLQIENANNELIESMEQIEIASLSVNQAKEHLQITKHNYDAGLIKTSDMLEAQAMLKSTQNQFTDALCTNKIKQAQYKKSKGELN